MLKKFTAVLMAVVLMFAMSVSALAQTPTTDNLTTSVVNGVITERLSLIDSDGIPAIITRITNPNGSAKVILEKNKEKTIFYGQINYASLLSFATTSKSRASVDVHGSNFNHEYLSSYTRNATADELTTDTQIIASLLCLEFGVPLLVARGFASVVRSMLSRDGVVEVDISSDVYEVFFAYDDVYYCHCYHEVVVGYDSVGHKVGTTSKVYQAVGG